MDYPDSGVLLGPDRRPVERPVILDHRGQPIRHPYDDYALPQVFTFGSIIQGANRTFLHDRFDEALRHGEEAHQVMRRDCYLMGLLQERKLATASLKWHLEVDDEKEAKQRQVKEGLTKIVRSVPRLQKLFMTLLESIWYGRYAVQLVWKWHQLPLPSKVLPPAFPGTPAPASGVSMPARCLNVWKWTPVNGDKLGWTHDGVPYVLIHSARQNEIQGNPEIITATSRGHALALKGSWRERFLIHQHELDDADFLDGEAAVSIHGVGVRSRIFWLDWLKRDYLEWVISFFERLGLGLTLWFYESGNDASKLEVEKQARDSSRRTNLLVPVTPGRSGQGIGGVERIETPVTGTEALRVMVDKIDEYIERYVVGQSMSSGADNDSGLGGSGRAKFAEKTKRQITKFDANNLSETLTGSDDSPGLLSTIKRWTYPWADFPVRFIFDVDDEDPETKLEAVNKAVSIGVDFKKNEVRALTGLSDPEPGDDVIGGASSALPGDQNAPPDGEEGEEEDDDPFEFGRKGDALLYDQSRGQPGNAGQFGPGGAGPRGPAPKGRKTLTPKEKQRREVAEAAKQHAASGMLAAADAAGHVAATTKDVVGKVGAAAWERLPEGARKKLETGYRWFKAAEHVAMTAFRKGKELAIEIAKERGLSQEQAETTGRLLAISDLALAWTVNMPATAALTGSLTLAKASSWVPVASFAYIAYSGVRDPLATLRAAKTTLKSKGEPVQHAAEYGSVLYQADGPDRDLVARVIEKLDAGGDRYSALLHVAMDECRADLKQAMAMADGVGELGQTDYRRSEKGRWITIGGSKGADGKRKGGSPVYVEAGRITKGHPSLTGKKIDALKEEAEPDSHRRQLNQSKGHGRAVWSKKAKAEGIDAASLHQLAAEVLEHDRAYKAEHTRLLREAREALSEFGGQYKTIHRHAALGGDADTIKGLDEVAEDLVVKYPNYFPSDSEHASDTLYGLLSGGNPEPLTEEEAYEQAMEQLSATKGYRPSDEPIPFIRSDTPTFYAFTGIITDSLGREMWYKGGKHVANPGAEERRDIERTKGFHHVSKHEHDSPEGKAATKSIHGGSKDHRVSGEDLHAIREERAKAFLQTAAKKLTGGKPLSATAAAGAVKGWLGEVERLEAAGRGVKESRVWEAVSAAVAGNNLKSHTGGKTFDHRGNLGGLLKEDILVDAKYATQDSWYEKEADGKIADWLESGKPPTAFLVFRKGDGVYFHIGMPPVNERSGQLKQSMTFARAHDLEASGHKKKYQAGDLIRVAGITDMSELGTTKGVRQVRESLAEIADRVDWDAVRDHDEEGIKTHVGDVAEFASRVNAEATARAGLSKLGYSEAEINKIISAKQK